MTRITLELLRQRAEHNECMVSNLEQITLHQDDIEKIEHLDSYCRHLQILYLQNNIIDQMENLSKLKELQYLNLALNNIAQIQGLDGCQSLQKIDFTVNFIDVDALEESMKNLQHCKHLKEMYLTGNPCTDWKGYRDFVVASLDSLETLDGKEITPSDRIKAKQNYQELLVDLMSTIEYQAIEKERIEKEKSEEIKEEKIYEDQDQRKREEQIPYTRESRKQMYMEIAEEQLKKDKQKNPEKYQDQVITPTVHSNGDMRQCNEGKYNFKLDEWEDSEYSVFEIMLPKYLDTSQVTLNLMPNWVSIRIKDKLTQIRLNQEIIVDKSTSQRSQTTGALVIKMLKLNPNYVIQSMNQKQKDEELQLKKKKQEDIQLEKQQKLEMVEKYENQTSVDKVEQVEKVYNHTTFDDVPELE